MALAQIEITRNTSYDEMPQYVNVREAAAFLGTSTWFIYKGIHEGQIPHRRMGPKILLIPKEYFHPSRAQKQVAP
jgi:excisionase family DNA binding protein